MGFWDFVAPDFDSFDDRLSDVLPDFILIGKGGVDRETAIRLAWVNPGSAAGLAARIYLELDDGTPAGRERARRANNAAQQHGTEAVPNGEWKVSEGMTTLVIPRVYRVSIEAVSGGQDVINVVHVRGADDGLHVEATQAVRAAWKVASGPLAVLSSVVTLTGFRGMDLSALDGGIHEIADTSPGGTGYASGLATNAACALVKWNGGTRSRSTRGRLYYGPLAEAQINTDGRTIATASAASINTAFNNFRASLTAAGFGLVVVSRKLEAAYDVSSSAVETVIATQRRRIRS